MVSDRSSSRPLTRPLMRFITPTVSAGRSCQGAGGYCSGKRTHVIYFFYFCHSACTANLAC